LCWLLKLLRCLSLLILSREAAALDNATLTALHLGGNNRGAQGACALAEADNNVNLFTLAPQKWKGGERGNDVEGRVAA
jgi:hypothetical protein